MQAEVEFPCAKRQAREAESDDQDEVGSTSTRVLRKQHQTVSTTQSSALLEQEQTPWTNASDSVADNALDVKTTGDTSTTVNLTGADKKSKLEQLGLTIAKEMVNRLVGEVQDARACVTKKDAQIKSLKRRLEALEQDQRPREVRPRIATQNSASARQPRLCKTCGKQGHLESNCFRRIGYPPTWNAPLPAGAWKRTS